MTNQPSLLLLCVVVLGGDCRGAAAIVCSSSGSGSLSSELYQNAIIFTPSGKKFGTIFHKNILQKPSALELRNSQLSWRKSVLRFLI